MGEIIVKYNNQSLSPVPLVSYNQQFIDYNKRWGQTTQIELNGWVTGINGTGCITGFTDIFTGQFGTLTVSETNGSSIYNWENVVVDTINFQSSPFYSGTKAAYTASLRSFSIPSGVVEPINEFSFNQGEDGLVVVNHKISARGIKNSNPAFDNAVNFVKHFTGCDFVAFFVPSGNPILLSKQENIDRLSCTYAISESYKYVTGQNTNYLETFTLGVSDIIDNLYLTIDTDLKIQGSTITGNISSMDAVIPTINILSRIESMGFNTGLMAKTNSSLSRDSGACIINIKNSYISGYNSGDLTGHLDYSITLNSDNVLPKDVWSIDGEYKCVGPIDYRINQLNIFKNQIPDWRIFLSGLITSSPIFTTYHVNGNSLSSNLPVNIKENSGLAVFQTNLTLNEGADRIGANQKYNVEVTPSRWQFDTLSSANIEGHNVIQDPQMRNRAKISIDVTADSLTPGVLVNTADVILNELSGIYVDNGTTIAENIATGLTDINYHREWIGMDQQSSGLLNTKMVGSIAQNFIRQAGFRFGY